MDTKRIRLWDLPTRLFHWALVLAMIAAVVSGELGGPAMDWHGRIGLLIVGLIAFRLAWGRLGSTYARFAQFLPTPSSLKAYRRGDWQGEGHNPYAALAIFGLLGLLVAQVTTGLLSNDDLAFVGPLAELIGRDLSNRLSGMHRLLSDVLIGLVVLHVAAVGFYVRVKKQALLKPMVTGWKEGAVGDSAEGGGFAALLVALLIAAAVVFAASGAWLPQASLPTTVAETANR